MTDTDRRARRARWWARAWWAQLPIGPVIALVRWEWVQRAGLGYLATVTIVSLAVTYEAKAAGYENP